MRREDARISGEDALVARIRGLIDAQSPHRACNRIGDDVAVWQPSRSHRSVITTDASIEGVHFTRELMSLHDAGYRAMAANVSDIAAAGARPVVATLALGVPHDTASDDALAICEGVVECASEFGCEVVGGDLVRSPLISIAITLTGEVRATHFKGRGGARPGDILAVSGPLGAACAGLKLASAPHIPADANSQAVLQAFRRPRPRLAQGRWLAASSNVHAMMDLSDGLAADLPRLCERSNCGAIVEHVPVAPGATGDDALAGGEDYELLVSIAPRAFGYLAQRFQKHFGAPLIAIGKTREERGVAVIRNGSAEPLQSRGFDHFASVERA